MPTIDFEAVDKPNFVRPELLRHHTIPKPLFGTTPRYIKGQEWWDETRRAAYIANNMRCWACGGPGPLEAHEAYEIDYDHARMTYIETVSLCNDCHSFIHIGRTMGFFARGAISHGKAKQIVLKGYRLLRDAGLRCTWEVGVIASPTLPWKPPRDWIQEVLRNTDLKPTVPMHDWNDWRLVLDGVEYPPRYKSFDEFSKTLTLY